MDQQNQQIQVSVFAYRPDQNDMNVILYSISVTNKQNDSWILEKRYSQFEGLQKALKEYFGEQLPKLPKKSYITFIVKKSHDDIEQRRVGLDTYLKALVKRNEVITSTPVRDFLELEKHAKEIILNPPELIYEFTGFLHGIRDCSLSSEQGVLFVVNSDCSVITRLDAYITNMKGPWESENGEEALIPVGCVECWLQNEQGEFQRQWTKMYNSQAICCNWEPISCTLLVGLDSGSINYLRVPISEGLKKYEESMEIEQHLDRVMGVAYDRERRLIHSVSKDHKYRVLSLQKECLIADLEPSMFELTYLVLHEGRKKTFISDRCGSIFIFDITNPKPTPVIQLNTSQKFIRGLYVDNEKGYLLSIGYEDGELCNEILYLGVFDINKPGKEQHTKQISSYEGKAKSREIAWSSKRGEIYIGNVDGTVTIWDAKQASPIYVIKAHESDVTKLLWLEADQSLMTAGKDKVIKAWRLPKNWRDPHVVEKEVQNSIAQQKQQNIENQQKKQQQMKELQVEDDEDDMVVWHKQEQQQHNQENEGEELK